MTKIKVIGAVIFALSIILAILFAYMSKQNKENIELLHNINLQKEFTQEISKNIFYIYKNQNNSCRELDSYMKDFVQIMNKKNNSNTKISNEDINKLNKRIVKSWNEFYLEVQHFRDQSRVKSAYSSIVIEKTVNDIYNKNLMLIVDFDSLIKIHNLHFNDKLNTYKYIQYTLFFLLVTLLIYLFTQVKMIISFIQKFVRTSQNIIKTSSIKELESIEVKNNSSDVLEATNNFNFLVNKINKSIEYSNSSIQHSIDSLESVENNIEDLLELVDIMEDVKTDKELTKKEDVLIQSLEELTSSAQNLKNLKVDFDNLISQQTSCNS